MKTTLWFLILILNAPISAQAALIRLDMLGSSAYLGPASVVAIFDDLLITGVGLDLIPTTFFEAQMGSFTFTEVDADFRPIVEYNLGDFVGVGGIWPSAPPRPQVSLLGIQIDVEGTHGGWDFSSATFTPLAVAEPSTLILLAFGLVCTAFFRQRFRFSRDD